MLRRPQTDIIGITMPGMGTTDRTYQNALTLMRELRITSREISIKDACLLHFDDIGHAPDALDVTFENVQARERYQILFDVANMEGGLVVGTGDMSELALGWCTYNGDHMSNYGVNAGVPKSLVKHLICWYADTSENKQVAAALYDILDTPISPELLPADENGGITQKTEDIVGPYELHDFFLFHTVRNGFAPKKVLKLATLAFDGVYAPDFIARCWRFFTSGSLHSSSSVPACRTASRSARYACRPGRLAHAQRCVGGGLPRPAEEAAAELEKGTL